MRAELAQGVATHNASTVGRWVIVAKDLQGILRVATGGDGGEQREQIARSADRAFADLARGVCTCTFASESALTKGRRSPTSRIEVAQGNGAPLGGRRVAHILDDHLADLLGATVAALSGQRRRLGNGDLLGRAVDGGRRGVDEAVALMPRHGLRSALAPRKQSP